MHHFFDALVVGIYFYPVEHIDVGLVRDFFDRCRLVYDCDFYLCAAVFTSFK